MAELLVVLGSSTAPGRLRRALAAAAEEAPFAVELIDLAERPLGFLDGAPAAAGSNEAGFLAAVGAAPALVFATPVYRGSLSGTLKNALDLLPVPALAEKSVGIVAMGASHHHFLGAERHLRDVLAFFGARPMPVAAYLTSADFDEGSPSAKALEQLRLLFTATVGTAAALGGREDVAGPPSLGALSERR